jgi:hypothetical protein
VVEQGEVVRAADVQPVLGLERDPPRARAARRARREHEEVADEAADGMAVRPRHRRAHEAVRGALEQRDLLAGGGAERVRVAVEPVLVDEGALAEVADPCRAPPQEARERLRLRHRGQRRARDVHRLLERRAHVRRAQGDDVADMAYP